jgi:mono/diheme cytochrome c family protein
VTEIPEHLLKRSRERRSSLGLPTEGGSESGGAEPPSGDTPAVSPAAGSVPATRAAAPAPAPAPPPKPIPAYVQASLRRRRIPLWAMPVVALLPVWLFVYVNAMKPSTAGPVGPLAEGSSVYTSKCVSCHGGTGEGGVGYQLSQGEVQKTFPKIEDQIPFVFKGTAGFIGKPYGSGRHVGGVKGQMPAWGGELTDVEILAAICHERYDLSTGLQTSKEFIDWCTVDGAKWVAVGTGGFAAAGISGLKGT